MSLAQEWAIQAPPATPDSREVRDDSLAILRSALEGLRRPMLVAFVAIAVAAVIVAAAGRRPIVRRSGSKGAGGPVPGRGRTSGT